jgi:hypothetical protein
MPAMNYFLTEPVTLKHSVGRFFQPVGLHGHHGETLLSYILNEFISIHNILSFAF